MKRILGAETLGYPVSGLDACANSFLRFENIKKFITDRGGVVSDTQLWGKRRLAYTIKYSQEGFYVLLKFTMKPNLNRELEANLGISEDILRHLLIRV